MSFLNLDADLARIGCPGPRPPVRPPLAEILLRHVSTIPFENLDVLLGRPIRTDAASLEQKLVRDRRGGYCFEQNHLLADHFDLHFPAGTRFGPPGAPWPS